MDSTLLIVGLGNTGIKYQDTRHNVGFMFIDYIINKLSINLKDNKSLKCEIASYNYSGKKVIFSKPTTYMNLSGDAVQSIVSFYKININNIIVVHDDIDLHIGDIKVKIGGGSGGHNGIKSIDSRIGNQYYRIRIGINRPEVHEQEVSSYVLEKFAANEHDKIMNVINKIYDNFGYVIDNKIEDFYRNIK